MVPEFESAVNELAAVDDVSEIITTEFGVHLIKLDGIEPESGKSFEEVKEEILETVKNNKADSEFAQLRELLNETSFDNPDSLDIAADETGLTLVESDWLDSETAQEGSLANPAVLQAALSEDVLDEGINSELIQVGNRHVMVLRVKEHEGPRAKTIDDVREEVELALQSERAETQLDEAAEAALAKMRDGGEVEAIAEENELSTARIAQVIERQTDLLDRNIATQVFSQAKPSESEPVFGSGTLANGNRLVWNLVSVDVPELESEESGDDAVVQIPSTPAGANPRLGGVEFSALLESLREAADVDLEP